MPQERTATEARKARLDEAQLALQNVLYEKAHYLNETRAMLNFPCALQATERSTRASACSD